MSTAARLDLEPEILAARITDAHASDDDWMDRFQTAIGRRRSGGELQRVLAVWSLSKADAARLFGVTRQAILKWTRDGVPADRLTAVGDLAAATDLLLRFLRPDRIPAVVRRPFDDAGGRTLLELVADDPALALAHVRAMFDVSRAHV
ncbi:MAG: hypothetical protein JNK12_23565 [Acidimicrobiales bacterium]|nr:hypothetical protein [Acidimicrobiales bacterium]